MMVDTLRCVYTDPFLFDSTGVMMRPFEATSKSKPSSWSWAQFPKHIYVLLVIFFMGISGFLAFYEGATKYSLLVFQHDAQLMEKVATAKAQPSVQTITAVSTEVGFFSNLVAPERFTNSRLLDLSLFYNQLSPYANAVLAIHIFFSSFCMILGGFQFWPAFRKKYMSQHRTFGKIYIVTVPIAMVTAILYLLSVKPDELYTHFTGYVALWILAVITLLGIVGAMRALQHKRIYEHQAYMALTFGALMIAPMLRWNWVGLGLLFPQIDQETVNLITLILLIPENLLIAYGLMLINRQWQRPQWKRAVQPFASRCDQMIRLVLPMLYVGVLLMGGLIASQYLFDLPAWIQALFSQFTPLSYVTNLQAVFEQFGWLRQGFALSVISTLALAVYVLGIMIRRNQTSELVVPMGLAYALSVVGVIAAGSSIALGWQIGIQPEAAILSGGTVYVAGGLLILFFTLMWTIAIVQRWSAQAKEALVFLIGIVPFPAFLLVVLWVMQFVPLPTAYVLAGQGYQVAAGASLFMLIPAFFYVVYGQATRVYN
ncbi:MAG: DUF2306 domain-containing protein [Pseudomonadota bacterium]|nr:DUF2306 domain-containing protein [Pseudomonadota bacterium]